MLNMIKRSRLFSRSCGSLFRRSMRRLPFILLVKEVMCCTFCIPRRSCICGAAIICIRPSTCSSKSVLVNASPFDFVEGVVGLCAAHWAAGILFCGIKQKATMAAGKI
ncbi:hypothetical protein BS50DRAFT_207141 [Corynespora cassiicola Philippines]|uniref:Uncharacterized protein n=1 Tax=Corynespora cassiicola Philippines TaxID=1448308 RepID=A0A2T2N5N8_CORCC|nr:hypothetical protein BS50DRAFT_207141 [Corynespora cassiicola Philippines]